MDYISDIENKEYSIEDIMKRWGNVCISLMGFLKIKKKF